METFQSIQGSPMSAGSARPNGSKSQESQGMGRFVKEVRGLFSYNLRLLILLMMLGVSVLPISFFYKWVEQTSFNKEVAYVDENHLIIAKNLSAAMSRYVNDMKSVFDLVVQNKIGGGVNTGFGNALGSFNLCSISILNDRFQTIGEIEGSLAHGVEVPELGILKELKILAAEADGEVAISGIQSFNGTPHFFVVQQLDDGSMAFAPWSPKYIVQLQKSIAFGERGHSMVVDQHGHVVAHPNAGWQASSKDASKLSVVRAMLAGKTGVMQFFSPPLKADMIAGYTHVPETGWGVMVPQPISELAVRARDVQSVALVIAATEIFLAVLISLKLSAHLAGPIQSIARSAGRVAKGDFTAHVGSLPPHTPVEIRQLGRTFDGMVDDLALKTKELEKALTETQKLSEERGGLLAQSKEASDAKSRFVSMVSHELRTPLTSIKGSLDLMESGALGALPKGPANLVSIAAKNANRLSIMIDDLLDLGRLDTGMMQYHFDKLDMADIIHDSIEANQSYGQLNNVTFSENICSGNILVKGDYNRLMQVMANLLSNAAKFSHKDATVVVSLKTEDGCAVVTVKDSGIGIPANSESKVFESFVQLDSPDIRKVGGSGLGLGIAKTIVEKHGGDIGYTSEVGKGSEFFMKLPLSAKGAKK